MLVAALGGCSLLALGDKLADTSQFRDEEALAYCAFTMVVEAACADAGLAGATWTVTDGAGAAWSSDAVYGAGGSQPPGTEVTRIVGSGTYAMDATWHWSDGDTSEGNDGGECPGAGGTTFTIGCSPEDTGA